MIKETEALKPVIGVTSNIREERLLTIGMDNVHSIIKAGGAPIVLPNIRDNQAIDRMVERLDGLLITGGGDIDPTLFGEEPIPQLGEICPDRDYFEMSLIQKCLEQNKPILGICRGCQILNVSIGGDIFQDIYAQHSEPLLQHYQKAPRYHTSHFVDITENSKLRAIMGESRIKVNSYHHQAVKTLGTGYEVCAISSDGIIEAFECKESKFVIGVQWHPENMMRKDENSSVKLFQAFVQACKQI